MEKIIEDKLKILPNKPGVYLMKDKDDVIIYVGKAKILKNRVRSYFINLSTHNNKTLSLVKNICDLNWIVTDNEVEALILECNLIKKYRPKYNILLKDDKSFPYIKITLNEPFPRIFMTRDISDKNAKYFGPYTNSAAVKTTIEHFKKTFLIRSCNRDLPKDIGKKRECLNYHIKQCSAPCVSYILQEEYREKFNDIVNFLEGREDNILKKLTARMEQFSNDLEFEQAADLRDKINYLKFLLNKQKINAPKDAQYDAIGFSTDDFNMCFTVLFIRGGKLLGNRNIYFKKDYTEQSELLEEFLKRFYDNSDMIPKEILLPFNIAEVSLMEDYFFALKGKKVELSIPRKGKKRELIELANKNAKEALNQKLSGGKQKLLVDLKELLSLEKIPERIEVYDISNTAGKDMVGLMTVFIDGEKRKSEYRKFKIKYVEEQDDYASMKEVVYRRLMRYVEEKQALEDEKISEKDLKFINLPDLIFVDGGKNHVNSALQACEMSGINLPIFGLVKDSKHRTKDIVSSNHEYNVARNRPLFSLVSKMQDETHNSAINFHHSVRTKTTIKSELLNISGVGEKNRLKLLAHYKSPAEIMNATYEDLIKIVPKNVALNIVEYYKGS